MTLVISSEINFDEVLNISWDTIRNEQRQLYIDEMNKKYIDLQQEQTLEEPQTEEPPPIEESQDEKELKILNYKK